MSSGPNSEVRIWSIVDRRGASGYKARPWVVRWKVDGNQFSRGHRTRSEADHFRSGLLAAQRNGERFDGTSGEPLSWAASGEIKIHDWVRRWVGEQWPEWQPRTRNSAVEALSRYVPLVVRSGSPPADGLRIYLVRALRVGGEGQDDRLEAWMNRWCLDLSDLDRQLLATVEQKLVTGLDGKPLAQTTASRYRNTAKGCIQRAVDLELIPRNPWPPATKGARHRKARRKSKAVDIRQLPDPATMRRALDAIVTHQPASRRYFVMTAVLYYAGLRPSEVIMLRPRVLSLPAEGWGTIDVVESDIDFDEPGEPKTGERTVPIPGVLVEILRGWVEQNQLVEDSLLFRTRNGNRPTSSNWRRAWHRALRSIDHETLRLYDCRHAAATTWLSAGVPLGETARRLGHSIEVLVSTYVGALAGDVESSNELIDKVLD